MNTPRLQAFYWKKFHESKTSSSANAKLPQELVSIRQGPARDPHCLASRRLRTAEFLTTKPTTLTVETKSITNVFTDMLKTIKCSLAIDYNLLYENE